jgi:hypothetical protein
VPSLDPTLTRLRCLRCFGGGHLAKFSDSANAVQQPRASHLKQLAKGGAQSLLSTLAKERAGAAAGGRSGQHRAHVVKQVRLPIVVPDFGATKTAAYGVADSLISERSALRAGVTGMCDHPRRHGPL